MISISDLGKEYGSQSLFRGGMDLTTEKCTGVIE